MAEAIALGAGVIAFIQLADRVIHLTKYYIEAIRDCPRDIRTILVEISSLKAVLENLDFLLKNGSGPETHMLDQLTGEHGPIAECQKSLAKLERLLPSDVKAISGKRQKILTAAEHLKWPLRENSAKKLIDDISRYKASIAFALTFDSTKDIKDIKKDLRSVKATLSAVGLDEVCTWLESTNPSSNHNNAWKLRENHTGLWMIQSTEWQEWLEGKKKFVWIHGIPGAGKTVLASFLIEQAQRACGQQTANSAQRKFVVCVYYYCYFARNQDETAPFLRWLVSQLCRQSSLVPSAIDRLFQLKHAPSISQLLNALHTILEEFAAVYVVIDAVDESQSREDLLRILRDLATDQRFDKIRLLATSREYYDIEVCFSDMSSKVSMNNPVVEDDIRRFAHSALVSNRKFRGWPPNLIAEVESALAKGAKGMFRWAVCQIDVLQRLGRIQDVRLAVSNLPKTLDETYERIFQLLAPEDHRFVQLALIFICGNNDLRPVPMQANVLLQAILSRVENAYNNFSNDVGFYDRDTLKDRCGCLISFSTYANTEFVSLAHYTVKEFLYSDRVSHSSVPSFALSDFRVRTTFLRAILEIVIERQDKPEPPTPHSFYSYAIVATQQISLDDHEWKPKIGKSSIEISHKWKPSMEIEEIKDLVERYCVFKSSLSYLEVIYQAFRSERQALIVLNGGLNVESRDLRKGRAIFERPNPDSGQHCSTIELRSRMQES